MLGGHGEESDVGEIGGHNKGGEREMVIRRRLVARDFKGKDRGRDDLFADTPPLEAKRMLLSKLHPST